MKTAISIPDALFRQAERFARERSVSRSELYARALAEHLRREAQSHVTESFDAAYDDEPEQDAWGSVAEFRGAAKRRVHSRADGWKSR